jgi:membrane fusion protein, copper/silver efflux system
MAEQSPTSERSESLEGVAQAKSTPEQSAPRSWLDRFRRFGRSAVIVLLIGVSFWLGTRCESDGTGSALRAEADDELAIAYWTCSMHPQIQQPDPGSCPICGMELVPVKKEIEEERPKKKAKQPKYACAMMCVPPLDLPGKCPICGMDMVAVEEEDDDDDGTDASRAENVLGEIRLSERARRLAQLEVAPVVRQMVAAEVRMVGKVDFDETRVRTISARVPGRLDRLFVDFTGISVRKGDHLAELYSPELLAAQAELLEALRTQRAQSQTVSPELRRMREESLRAARQKLLLWGVMPEQLDEIEKRGTTSDHLTIYAPIGGIVTDKRLSEGAYVEEGTEIYKIADLNYVWVMLDAYELDLAWIRYGQDVEFTTEAYGGETFHGTIAFIDPVLDPLTRTAKVRVNVPNPERRLKPEMFVRAVVRSQMMADGRVVSPALAGKWICPMHPEVVAETADNCTQCGMPLVTAESLGYAAEDAEDTEPPLVIPSSAPLMTGKRAIVYVAQPDRPGRYEGREVVLGPRAGDFYPVREGLAEGEQVVVRGALYLDSAVQILGRPSMMHPDPDVPASPPGHDHQGTREHTMDAAHPEHETGPDRLLLPNEANSLFDPIFAAYMGVQHALAHDQYERSADATRELIRVLAAFEIQLLPEQVQDEGRSLLTDLTKKVEAIAATKDIESARAAFEPLSNAMITAAKRWGVGSRERLLVYHCPMAFNDRGASWLQDKEGVENPYFGAAMFRCGFLEETVKRQSAETSKRQDKELGHQHE